MNIAVTTLLFGEVPYFRYTEAINRRYCQLHGYRFVVTRPEYEVDRSPIWYKVRGVRELLIDSDYVLFLDADAYFCEPSRSIEELIAEHMGDAAMILGTDRRDKDFAWSDNNGNCGVFLVRRCAEAFRILDDWWQSPLKREWLNAGRRRRWLWQWPPEQGSFNSFIRLGRNRRWIRTIYYAHMNGVDGGFIRHLIGFTDEQRLEHLRVAARDALKPGLEATSSGANSP